MFLRYQPARSLANLLPQLKPVGPGVSQRTLWQTANAIRQGASTPAFAGNGRKDASPPLTSSIRRWGSTSATPAEPPYDISKRARELGVALSPSELEGLIAYVSCHFGDCDGRINRSNFVALVRTDRDNRDEKEALVNFISKIDENSFGQRMLLYIDFVSTALFAMIGTVIAGQAGMNIVGTTFVGSVAAMGGGSLNNMLTGVRGGVFWVRDWRFLAISLAVSIATFHLWPMYEESVAEHFCADLHLQVYEKSARGLTTRISPRSSTTKSEREDVEGDGVTYEEFKEALDNNPALAKRLWDACGPKLRAELGQDAALGALDGVRQSAPDGVRQSAPDGVRLLFNWLTKGGTELEPSTLQLVARWEVLNSPRLYAFESVALGAVAVNGAQAGINRGVHPLASIVMGVTICFGGILRDLLCQRPVAIGGQSYALATGAGASVYVLLRQLVVAGYAIPVTVRIAIGGGTTIGQRALSYYYNGVGDTSFLAPMANYRPEKH